MADWLDHICIKFIYERGEFSNNVVNRKYFLRVSIKYINLRELFKIVCATPNILKFCQSQWWHKCIVSVK